MSPPHTHTVSAGLVSAEKPSTSPDDEEGDICPICDGDCTCNNNNRLSTTTTDNALLISGSHLPLPTTPAQSLKIRLTIPPSMLNKNRMLGAGKDDDSHPLPGLPNAEAHEIQQTVVPKRRGRPPKALLAARKAAQSGVIDLGSGNEANTLSGASHPRKRGAALPKRPYATSKARGTTVKKSTKATSSRRKTVLPSDSESLSDPDEDANFPTFVSACSTTSDNDDSDTVSSSEFDSDSSTRAEEEDFILSEEGKAHDKARVRRELMGDEGWQKMKDLNNNWVIRPRKKSVDRSDDDMQVDTDDISEEEDEEEEEEEGEDDDDDDDADVKIPGAGYAGAATGWSEDEESSFDADLFFANLSSSDSDQSAPSDVEDEGPSELGASAHLDSTIVKRDTTNLPLEVTESWDGQIVFSNGMQDGQGILDHDFDAVQSLREAALVNLPDSDVEMQTSDGADDEDEDEDDCVLDETDGETTEEELVGSNGLPTERAMKLFRLPTSISVVNPLSTMSPAASPKPRSIKSLKKSRQLDSPTPTDILLGKVVWEDSDEHESESVARSPSTRGGVPIMGQFEVALHKSAILTGLNKDVPSPFPRLKRHERRSRSRSSRFGSFSGPDAQTPPVPLLTYSPFQTQSTDEIISATEPSTAELIDLDDVLDSSFLDSDHNENHLRSSETEFMKSLSRWDLISVGAFRQTRETAGYMPSAGPWFDGRAEDFEGKMKANPLTMLWQNKPSDKPKKGKRNVNVVISPVLLPVRDGDRTPPHTGLTPPSSGGSNNSRKTRKETRREKQVKRRSVQQQQYHHPKHQYHQHSHHPNMKTRSSGSMQRTNFFGQTSSVPPLNL